MAITPVDAAAEIVDYKLRTQGAFRGCVVVDSPWPVEVRRELTRRYEEAGWTVLDCDSTMSFKMRRDDG